MSASFRRRFALVALVAAGLPTLANAQAALKVEGAWARPTVKGQAAGGGFLKITGGAGPDKLVAVAADVSKSVELHSMAMDGDVMRMRQIAAIDVPAGQVVELKPGGLHVMFMGLKEPLKAGQSIPLTLRFEKAGEMKVDMKVMTPPAAPMPHAEHKH